MKPPAHDPGLRWIFYPRSDRCPDELNEVTQVFNSNHAAISSFGKTKETAMNSNAVLAVLVDDLRKIRFEVEVGKNAKSKIGVPVLYGMKGVPEKTYEVDAWEPEVGAVLEVEAGQAVSNFKFLKDLFEACVMDGVQYLILAVQNWYYSSKRDDFTEVRLWFDVAYASGRFTVPLKGILLIGY